MPRRRIAVIEGDDAAPEAMRPTLDLIDALGLEIEWLRPLVGEAAVEQTGHAFPDEARALIDGADTTLFGSTSGKTVLALFYLRWGKGTYANVRPARWWPGCQSPLANPSGIDFIIVRENLEDMYVGCEGELDQLAPAGLMSTTARRPIVDLGPGRFALKVITKAGTERVARFAFELARRRKAAGGRGKVTCSSKYNMLPRSDGFFREVTESVASEYPDIEFDTYIVDDFARRIVADPQALDVVVLPNLYGDVLSDLAAGLVGGLGLAASGCYGDDYAYFESAHGTAPDIAGQNVINPTATILSAAMMLEHLGEGEAADKVRRAVEAVYAEGKTLTPDQGGAARTPEFCEAVVRRF